MGRVLVRPRPPMVVAAQPASIAWAARDATTEQVAIGQKATVTLTAKAATVEAAVAGQRASVAMAARDAVGEGWSPAFTGWWRDYAGVVPWIGQASAGTSGANDIVSTTEGNPPSVGTALNGHGTANFNGVNQNLRTDDPTDTFINPTTFSGWVLMHPSTVDGIRPILVDGNSRVDVRINAGSVVLSVLSGSASVSRAISASAWSLVTFRYTGTAIAIGVNEIPGAAGGGSISNFSSSLSSTSYIRVGGVNPNWYAGLIAEIGLSDTALTDQDFTDVINYVNNRYGLSL